MNCNRRVAVIDLGSNSVRMNIFEINESGHHQLRDQAREKVRLSEGMGKELLIKPEPLRRLIQTLCLFRKLIENYEVDTVYPFATAALRMAHNQSEVLQEIEEKTEFRFQILSGSEEATLDYIGTMNTIDLQDCLIVDIGGASTEIILVKNRQMVEKTSISWGSVNLTERFSDSKKAYRFIRKKIEKLSWIQDAENLPIIGLGGTIRTVAKIQRVQDNWPLYPMHNYTLNLSEVKRIIRVIANTPQDLIKRIPGISTSRQDIIKRGIIPFHVLVDILSPSVVKISMNGIREGFFLRNYFLNELGKEVVDDVLEASIQNLEKRYQTNPAHSEYVTRLSLQLFDLIADPTFTEIDRKILEVASRLHDIGMHIDYYSHHLHGFYLMIQSGLFGMEDDEVIRCALLVGLHRQKPIFFDLLPYVKVIGLEIFEKTKELALFLSLAEQLDRSESQKVETIYKEKNQVKICLRGGEEASLEEKASLTSVRLLEKKYQVKIVFE